MGTLRLRKTMAEKDEIKPEVIDWEKFDSRCKNYESQKSYLVYPDIIYHFIGPPVNKLFPSTDNLLQFKTQGIYFNEYYFVEVSWNDDESRWEAEIISPVVSDLKRVTYSIKFISTRFLKNNRYFGFHYTDHSDHVCYSRSYNLNSMEGRSDYNFNWSDESITILNEDEVARKLIFTRPDTENKNIHSFFESIKADVKDESSEYYNFLIEGSQPPESISNLKDIWREKKEQQKGKGKDKSSGKGYDNKGKGKGGFNFRVDAQLAMILSQKCYIIEDEDVYKVAPDQELHKISLTDSANRDQNIESLKVLIQILENKLAICESVKSKGASSKPSSPPKPKAKPKPVTKPASKTKRPIIEDEEDDE